MKDAVIVQQVYKYQVDDYRPMLELIRPVHKAYAEKWNMDYLTVIGPVKPEWSILDGGWAKLILIRDMLLKGYEYVFWIDADALIVDFETDLRTGCPDGLGAVEHTIAPGKHLNVGVMFVRNSDKVKTFFEEWISHYPGEKVFPWMEQGELHKMKSDPKWDGVVHQIDAKWNSCLAGGNQVSKPVIEGFHGMGLATERYQHMKTYMKMLAAGKTTKNLIYGE
jgi:hypothetical protein